MVIQFTEMFLLQHEEQKNGEKTENKNRKKNNSTDVLSDISHEKTWTWLRKENFKREIESVLVAVYLLSLKLQ